MMDSETEAEHISRIRSAQLGSRGRQQAHRKSTVVANTKHRAIAKKTTFTTNPTPAWMRDMMVGIGFGLIPVILMLVFLPGGFKLLSIVVLVIAAGTGYLLGTPTDYR